MRDIIPNQYNIGTEEEQELVEDLINEAIQLRGLDFYYIPRNLVYIDEVFGEDRLSQFKKAYPIRMYFQDISGFAGTGFQISKFGFMVDHTATLCCAKRMWTNLIGQGEERTEENSLLPNRPLEGDLIYFPISDGLFEIKWVDFQNPFFQLGKQYVYQLHIETFQYASERIDTGLEEVDKFEQNNSFDININSSETSSRGIAAIKVTMPGNGYTQEDIVAIEPPSDRLNGKQAIARLHVENGEISGITLIEKGRGYNEIPNVTIISKHGMDAETMVMLDEELIPDQVNNLGKNQFTQNEVDDLLITDVANPFGDP